MKWTIEPLTSANIGAYRALFQACHSACYCHYWNFEGDKNAWLLQCATAPENNFEEQKRRVQCGDASAYGLLAFRDGDREAVGWLKIAMRAAMPKLRRLPVYRGLDLGDENAIVSIGCFLVHPEYRGHGVARALLAAAEDYARSLGAAALEAYPHDIEGVMHPENAWLGPASLFRSAGFLQLAGEKPYPVMRKVIA